jgi:hypothetical protein
VSEHHVRALYFRSFSQSTAGRASLAPSDGVTILIMLKRPARKTKIYLDDHRTVDVREDIVAHRIFVHHGNDRIVFHADNQRVVACQHQCILRPF